MAKKIEWLDQFANDQYSKMTKIASHKKVANQIIVDCSTYPNAKVGTLVDYDNTKYKIVDTKYRDKSGPGLLLEEVTACGGNCGPTTTGEVQTNNGVIPATTEVKNPTTPKTAAKKNFDLDFDALADFDDSKFNSSDIDVNTDNDEADTETDFSATEAVNELPGNNDSSEYPDTITRPGGVKPIPSADIEGPGKKHVTDAPYHPTYDPGEQYALESQDEWQDAADRTASAIQQEDAQDRTTVEGHYTWNQYIDAILNEDPAETLIMTDAEIPDINDNETDFNNNENENADLDMEESESETNADIDTDTDIDTDIDNDDAVDSAVDSMLNFDDTEESVDTDTDEDTIDFNNEEDLDLPDDEDFSMNNEELPVEEDENNDIPEDFSSEDFKTDEDENSSMNDEDLDIPSEEEEEEPKMANKQSKTKQLSRLAFKNQ